MEARLPSQKLISHSPDLLQLWEEGFVLEVQGMHLLIRDIPYVNTKGEVKEDGIFVTPLSITPDAETTVKPDTHVMYFIGDTPADKSGIRLENAIAGDKVQ